ncbi:MAG: hypothetical protein ACFFD2_29825 [Promethearchaeota archaeon]
MSYKQNQSEFSKEASTKSESFKFLAFKLNVESEEFEELVLSNDDKVENLLDHDEILLFVDNKNCRVWIWEGGKTSSRMKFISAEAAHNIRDQYAIDYNITTIDDGDEPIEFRMIMGLDLEK